MSQRLGGLRECINSTNMFSLRWYNPCEFFWRAFRLCCNLCFTCEHAGPNRPSGQLSLQSAPSVPGRQAHCPVCGWQINMSVARGCGRPMETTRPLPSPPVTPGPPRESVSRSPDPPAPPPTQMGHLFSQLLPHFPGGQAAQSQTTCISMLVFYLKQYYRAYI